MEPHRHHRRRVDVAVDEGEVTDVVVGRRVGDDPELADRARRGELADALDKVLALLPPGDEIGDRDAREAVLAGEGLDLRPLHHRAVVVGELADHPDLGQAGERAEIDGGLGVPRAHEHAALAGDEREDVAGPHEVRRAHVGVGERARGVRALLGRDAGRQPVDDVDGDGEGGAERRVVRRHHRREVERPRPRLGQRRADDAAGVADDEGHLLRRAERGRADEVALVLAVVVVGDDDDLAFAEPPDRLAYVIHAGLPSLVPAPGPSCPRQASISTLPIGCEQQARM